MAVARHKNLAVTPAYHHLVEKAKMATGARTLQDITQRIVQAGLEAIAPEVLLPPHNATSNITPEQFKELVRDEDDIFARRR